MSADWELVRVPAGEFWMRAEPAVSVFWEDARRTCDWRTETTGRVRGSFLLDRRYARCAVRYGSDPLRRTWVYGFRVVVQEPGGR